MRSLAHYCWRQGEMKGIKSKFSWDVPLYKLVLRRDSSANQEIMSSSHHKHKSAVLLGNNSPGGYGKEGLLQTTAVVITADKKITLGQQRLTLPKANTPGQASQSFGIYSPKYSLLQLFLYMGLLISLSGALSSFTVFTGENRWDDILIQLTSFLYQNNFILS